jgi:uncharacterized protein YfaS (alpha-2-macroglobulin family)
MGEVTVTTRQDRVQWGALHWQYLEQMDKVTPHESPFSLHRQLWRQEATEEGTRSVPLDEGGALRVGDKLTVRLELRTDRHLDFVHLKDMRAAGMEPVETLSGYRYQGGTGHYMSVRDASVDLFFDRITPGTHVLEYELRVTLAGSLSHGIATVQCMYAPEFSSHSGGARVTVAE